MNHRLLVLAVLAICSGITALGAPLQAQSNRMALVVFKKGTASLVRAGKETPAKVNDIVMEKDEIRTGKDGELSLQLAAGVMMKITASSTLVIEGIARDASGATFGLKLQNGSILARANKEGKDLNMTVQSPTAIAGVRGTEFIVDAKAEQTAVLVNQGKVDVANLDQTRSVSVEAGNKVVADTEEFRQGVLEAYEKQRFAIFDQFEKEKKAHFENVIDQIRRNKELLEGQKNK